MEVAITNGSIIGIEQRCLIKEVAFVRRYPLSTQLSIFYLGEEAKKVFNDAQRLLAEIQDQQLLQAHGVVGLFPAVSDGDDIVVMATNNGEEIGRLYGLRQQVSMKQKLICSVYFDSFTYFSINT